MDKELLKCLEDIKLIKKYLIKENIDSKVYVYYF